MVGELMPVVVGLAGNMGGAVCRREEGRMRRTGLTVGGAREEDE